MPNIATRKEGSRTAGPIKPTIEAVCAARLRAQLLLISSFADQFLLEKQRLEFEHQASIILGMVQLIASLAPLQSHTELYSCLNYSSFNTHTHSEQAVESITATNDLATPRPALRTTTSSGRSTLYCCLIVNNWKKQKKGGHPYSIEIIQTPHQRR